MTKTKTAAAGSKVLESLIASPVRVLLAATMTVLALLVSVGAFTYSVGRDQSAEQIARLQAENSALSAIP